MSSFAAQFPNLPIGRAGRLAAFGAGVQHALLWPARAIAARRVLAQLAAMSAHELSDIGLVRQDLVDFSAGPPDEDCGPRLTQARAARARLDMRRGGKAF